MKLDRVLSGFCVLASLSLDKGALAQSEEHVTAVAAQLKKSYVRVEATNGCPLVSEELLGWPRILSRIVFIWTILKGSVYVLNIAPGIIARWIETSCSKALPGSEACFAYVLACGKWNSSYIFPVSGT